MGQQTITINEPYIQIDLDPNDPNWAGGIFDHVLG